jgi:flagellar motor switch protein FliM
VTVRDVLSLQKGDIIKLERNKVDDNMLLKIGNKSKFFARPGVVGSHMAVQIIENVESHVDEEEMFKEIEGGE